MNAREETKMPSAQRLLRVSDLHVAGAHGQTLVRDVNLELLKGQSIGIVGESGSGKSMTLKSLVRLLPEGVSASGKVILNGESILDKSERQMRKLRGSTIALLMQDPFTMLNPLQTAGESIRESFPQTKRRNRSAARREIIDRLAEVGLEPDVASKYPFQLSGGMRQRVAIAAALACDPDVLLADEPTTALDVTVQAEVLQLIKRIQGQRNMGLILVTHDLQVAFSVCDRLMVMYAGGVVEEVRASDLAAEARHPYSLGLLLSELPATHYVENLNSIDGSVPEPDLVANQCSFAARCAWATDACVTGRPPLTFISEHREVACIRTDAIRDDMRRRRERISVRGVRTSTIGTPLVTVEELRKTYVTVPMFARRQRTVALGGVSFTIAAGESLGLIGESGSGKTTIARSILGLATPDSGCITVDGIDVSSYTRMTRSDLRRTRSLLQVVFQDPYSSLNRSLRIGSVLAEALSFRPEGTTSEFRTVEDMLEMVGLPVEYQHRLPAGLSGGERQRVAIARALAVNPRLLVCDEPVAALDVSVQAQVIELFREIQRKHGVSMLFITHDLSVARQVTDRAIVLYEGRIVEEGPTVSVLERPKHPYTQRLVRSVPRAQEEMPSHTEGELLYPTNTVKEC